MIFPGIINTLKTHWLVQDSCIAYVVPAAGDHPKRSAIIGIKIIQYNTKEIRLGLIDCWRIILVTSSGSTFSPSRSAAHSVWSYSTSCWSLESVELSVDAAGCRARTEPERKARHPDASIATNRHWRWLWSSSSVSSWWARCRRPWRAGAWSSPCLARAINHSWWGPTIEWPS